VLGNDSDPENDSLTVATTPVTPPTNGSLTLYADGSYSYTHDGSETASDSFVYQVCDTGPLCDTATVNLTITTGNEPPVANGDTGTLGEGGTLNEPAPGVLGNDSDPENDSLTVATTPVTPPTNGSLTLNADGSYTYIHDGSETASDSFVYQVCDTGTLCDTATVDLTITPANDPPLAEPAPGVLGNDSDPENDSLTVATTPVTPPTNGSLTLYADGSYTYIHDGSETASDSFVYQVCDTGPLCDTATVSITVTAVTVTMSFAPSNDAMVTSRRPTENYGSLTTLELRSQSNENIQSYLKFEVTGVSGMVRGAKLRLYVDKDSGDGGSIYAVSNDYLNTTTPWLEGGLTWNNAPGLDGTPLSTVGATTSGTWVEFDVTEVVTGDGTYSFGLGTDSRNRVVYRSKEAAENGPVLAIEIESNP